MNTAIENVQCLLYDERNHTIYMKIFYLTIYGSFIWKSVDVDVRSISSVAVCTSIVCRLSACGKHVRIYSWFSTIDRCYMWNLFVSSYASRTHMEQSDIEFNQWNIGLCQRWSIDNIPIDVIVFNAKQLAFSYTDNNNNWINEYNRCSSIAMYNNWFSLWISIGYVRASSISTWKRLVCSIEVNKNSTTRNLIRLDLFSCRMRSILFLLLWTRKQWKNTQKHHASMLVHVSHKSEGN
jgi:hypothetical protein